MWYSCVVSVIVHSFHLPVAWTDGVASHVSTVPGTERHKSVFQGSRPEKCYQLKFDCGCGSHCHLFGWFLARMTVPSSPQFKSGHVYPGPFCLGSISLAFAVALLQYSLFLYQILSLILCHYCRLRPQEWFWTFTENKFHFKFQHAKRTRGVQSHSPPCRTFRVLYILKDNTWEWVSESRKWGTLSHVKPRSWKGSIYCLSHKFRSNTEVTVNIFIKL